MSIVPPKPKQFEGGQVSVTLYQAQQALKKASRLVGMPDPEQQDDIHLAQKRLGMPLTDFRTPEQKAQDAALIAQEQQIQQQAKYQSDLQKFFSDFQTSLNEQAKGLFVPPPMAAPLAAPDLSEIEKQVRAPPTSGTFDLKALTVPVLLIAGALIYFGRKRRK